jgi:hypothetical protein
VAEFRVRDLRAKRAPLRDDGDGLTRHVQPLPACIDVDQEGRLVELRRSVLPPDVRRQSFSSALECG